MKRNLLTVLAIVSSSIAFAQVPKVPMLEHFTQASCGPCAGQNPVLKQTLDDYVANGGEYVKVAHQTSWPGVDPMNAAFPAGPDVRRNYYGVTGVPNLSLNGGPTDLPNNVVTAASITAAAQETTPYDISVTQTWANANTVTVDITVDNVTSSPISDGDKIYVAMIEDVVDYGTAPGSNGETVFYQVMRQMYDATNGNPDATGGAALGTIAANGQETYNFTISSLPSYLFDKTEVRFAVYIQNDGTKEIMQAGVSQFSTIPGIINVEANAASQAGSDLCDYSFTPVIEFTNNDAATPVTSVVAEYSINGGAPVQETYSGNLTQGQTATITFPAATLSGGTSVVSYEIISANGGQPWGGPAAISMEDETYNRLNANGSPAPLTEGMESAPLEAGTGYSRELTTAIFDAPAGLSSALYSILDGPTYGYGAAGAYGGSNRSIRVRFFSIQSGTMNLIMQKVNLGSNSVLQFDHAYRQFQAENDQVKVFLSTDCGVTETEIFSAAGSALATLPPSQDAYNAPAANDWATNEIDLSAYDNTDDVVIRFEFTSAFGNNLFIDNINIGQANSVTEEVAADFSIFPNPATDLFNVNLDGVQASTIQVINLQGKVLVSQEVANQTSATVDASHLAAGVYTVLVNTTNGIATKKLVIK
jgi:hypothetical protein